MDIAAYGAACIPSWAGGDRINLTVVGGAALNCALLGGFDIVLTVIDGTTTRLQAITALNTAINSVATATALAGADGDVIKTAQATDSGAVSGASPVSLDSNNALIYGIGK